MMEYKILCTGLSFLLLLLVIYFDLIYFQIPNLLVISLFLLFFSTNPSLSPSHYTTPFIILLIGFGLSLTNILGFGDSKLLATLAFGLGDEKITHLLIGIIFTGGATGIIFLICKKWIIRFRSICLQNKRITNFSSPFIPHIEDLKTEIAIGTYDRFLPYGIPIAITGIWLLSKQYRGF